jgi:hypothetical protein
MILAINQNTSPIVKRIFSLFSSILSLFFKKTYDASPAATREFIIRTQLEYIILLSGSAKIITKFPTAIVKMTHRKKYSDINSLFFIITSTIDYKSYFVRRCTINLRS